MFGGRLLSLHWLLPLSLWCASVGNVFADDQTAEVQNTEVGATEVAEPNQLPTAARADQFKEQMNGATLVGHFTVDSEETELSELTEERYEIQSVTQMPGSDLWMFTTRIVYSGKDLTVPVPLQIKWAGATPVITMEKITIPGLGTFSARVVIHKNRYAGTWQHDDVGGHLFGKVEPKSD